MTTGVQQTVRAEIATLMPQIANAAKGAVADARMRGGGYSKAGVEPNAFNSGGGIQDFRNWDSPLLIYPTTSQRYTGLDGTGSGGTGGSGGGAGSVVDIGIVLTP